MKSNFSCNGSLFLLIVEHPTGSTRTICVKHIVPFTFNVRTINCKHLSQFHSTRDFLKELFSPSRMTNKGRYRTERHTAILEVNRQSNYKEKILVAFKQPPIIWRITQQTKIRPEHSLWSHRHRSQPRCVF